MNSFDHCDISDHKEHREQCGSNWNVHRIASAECRQWVGGLLAIDYIDLYRGKSVPMETGLVMKKCGLLEGGLSASDCK